MFFVISDSFVWNAGSWQPTFYLSGAVAAILYIGNSFPYFRKKDTSVGMIMLPASVFEKFVYEYLSRVVLFTLLFPIFFSFIAHLVVPIAHYFYPKKGIISFSFDLLFPVFNRESDTLIAYYIIPALYILITSLFLAGAVIVRRYPLVKTLVSLGVFVLSIIGYFYLIMEKMKIGDSLSYFANRVWGQEEGAIKTFFALIIVTSITTLAYTYFKLKEKEV